MDGKQKMVCFLFFLVSLLFPPAHTHTHTRLLLFFFFSFHAVVFCEGRNTLTLRSGSDTKSEAPARGRVVQPPHGWLRPCPQHSCLLAGGELTII